MIRDLFIFFLILLLVGCGGTSDEEESLSDKRKPFGKVVGEISSVHPEQGFVLFRNLRNSDLTTGGNLSARSVDGRRIASLELTPESLGRYHAATFPADQERPRLGDIVVLSSFGEEEKTEFQPEL